jgi:hypothetical protein
MTETPPTAVDHIRYDLLTQLALRGVMRTVLTDIARKGLPGEHHFFITYDTGAAGVRMSPRLRSQYPKEITIVLQHQFWDLAVSEDAFEVGMSFGGIPERLRIPFDAIKRFLDPSVQFALQFEQTEEEQVSAAPIENTKRDVKAKTPALRKSRELTPKMTALPAVAADPPPKDSAGTDKDPDKPSGGGEVVRFDRFRKK